jgi:hypothetical protein
MFVRTNEWIRARQGQRRLPDSSEQIDDGILKVDMRHLDIESMTLTMKYMYTDCGVEMFDETGKCCANASSGSD